MGDSSLSDARRALECVVASRSFARAEQLRRLLVYIVTSALEGREGTLKESVIGVEVFDLPASFNPKSDPTVRMAMRRLRSRLSQYYGSEGREDPVVISLEPGRYVPQFVKRSEQEPQRVSIAVFPFESSKDAVGGPDCGGMVREAVVAKLAESRVFQLVGNESTLFMHGTDISNVAEKLQARYVVRGACHASPVKIRICTELVCPEKHESIWTGNHEQTVTDEIWTVQDDIAAELEKQISAKYSMRREAGRPEASGPGMHRLILQGRYHLHQDNTDSIRKSEACFRAALEEQPTSARAWAGLSIAQCYMLIYHMGPAQKLWRAAELAASRAVKLDSSLPEAFLARGMLGALSEFKPAVAGQDFERALTLNPDDNSVKIMDAMLHLVPLGKLDDAEDQMEAVLASDPLNPRALRMMAQIGYFQRRYEIAIELALSSLDIMPQSAIAWFILANSYDRLGHENEALRAFRRCEELMPFMRVLKWPAVLGAVGKNRQKWVRPSVLAAAKLLQASPRAPSAMVADLLIRLGEQERALTWLERAFRERTLRALYLAVDPAFDAVRSDDRCLRLIEELKSPSSRFQVAKAGSQAE